MPSTIGTPCGFLAKLARQYRITPNLDINLGYSQPDACMMMIVEFLHVDLRHGVQRFLLLLASLFLCRVILAWTTEAVSSCSIQDFCCSSTRDRPSLLYTRLTLTSNHQPQQGPQLPMWTEDVDELL